MALMVNIVLAIGEGGLGFSYAFILQRVRRIIPLLMTFYWPRHTSGLPDLGTKSAHPLSINRWTSAPVAVTQHVSAASPD